MHYRVCWSFKYYSIMNRKHFGNTFVSLGFVFIMFVHLGPNLVKHLNVCLTLGMWLLAFSGAEMGKGGGLLTARASLCGCIWELALPIRCRLPSLARSLTHTVAPYYLGGVSASSLWLSPQSQITTFQGNKVSLDQLSGCHSSQSSHSSLCHFPRGW